MCPTVVQFSCIVPQASHIVCLAAHSQVDGVACGFVSLSCDVDLDVLSTCFDLEPFQGLCRSLTSDDNAKSEAVVQGGYPRMVVRERTDVWLLYTDCCTMEPLYRGHHWDPAGCPV